MKKQEIVSDFDELLSNSQEAVSACMKFGKVQLEELFGSQVIKTNPELVLKFAEITIKNYNTMINRINTQDLRDALESIPQSSKKKK